MIVLDTNVISELMRARADPRVVVWVDKQPTDEVYLTAVTTAELRYGVARLPDGRRRTDLADRLQRAVEAGFTGRVLPFDDNAAAHYADIVVGRGQQGLVIGMADAQIAAICRSHSAGLATRNTKDFVHTGIDLIDPWRVAAD
ncbi:PilT protein domain-containing protein [Candidatus Protofrankia californiensis]|uniref:Ribonuclease VapC n=1 Tax=Candidatus Protofrankia californiensis TaxID=1839754 RepID=A0A1C3NUQ0_9ACTN|nr:PilT protein domain-containing protein [Candidatus Protofrankia californiensis]